MMMNNDDVVGDSMENNVGGGREDRTCTFSKRGICEQHLVAGTKLSIPAKKWKDRGRGDCAHYQISVQGEKIWSQSA